MSSKLEDGSLTNVYSETKNNSVSIDNRPPVNRKKLAEANTGIGGTHTPRMSRSVPDRKFGIRPVNANTKETPFSFTLFDLTGRIVALDRLEHNLFSRIHRLRVSEKIYLVKVDCIKQALHVFTGR